MLEISPSDRSHVGIRITAPEASVKTAMIPAVIAPKVTSGTEPQSSGRVGLKVVKILEAADQALHNGWAEEVVYVGGHQESDMALDRRYEVQSQAVP